MSSVCSLALISLLFSCSQNTVAPTGLSTFPASIVITSSKDTAQVLDSLTFCARSTDTNSQSYIEWDFGDGTGVRDSSAQCVTHSFSTRGEFKVRATLIRRNTVIASDSLTQTIISIPSLNDESFFQFHHLKAAYVANIKWKVDGWPPPDVIPRFVFEYDSLTWNRGEFTCLSGNPQWPPYNYCSGRLSLDAMLVDSITMRYVIVGGGSNFGSQWTTSASIGAQKLGLLYFTNDSASFCLIGLETKNHIQPHATWDGATLKGGGGYITYLDTYWDSIPTPRLTLTFYK